MSIYYWIKEVDMTIVWSWLATLFADGGLDLELDGGVNKEGCSMVMGAKGYVGDITHGDETIG